MKLITVGTSYITKTTIQSFKEAGFEVYACIGRDVKRVKQFAGMCGVEHCAVDYEGALSSPSVDCVYIATPNALHYEYAKKAINAGKNVFVEKPFCSNLKEAKELADLAAKNHVFIFETNMSFYNPALESLKRDLPSLGQLRTVELNFSKYSSKYDQFLAGENPNIFNPDYSAGALMDIGVYNIGFCVSIFGLPEEAQYYPNMTQGIDTSGIGILRYPSFVISQICGKDSGAVSHFVISGEKGYLYADGTASNFSSYKFKLNGQQTMERVLDPVDQRVNELSIMKKIIEDDDHEKMNAYLTLSLMEMKVLDQLRASCGLKFKAD